MADESFSIDVSVTGDTEAVADLGKVVQAEEKVTRAAAQNVRQQSDVNAAVTAGGQKWGQLASSLGNVGSVFGRVSPMMGQAGQILGQIGAASTALTGALGPVGVALGVVTTAAGILIPLLESTSGEMADVGDAAETAADRVQRLGRAIEEAARTGRRQAGIEGSAAARDERATLRDQVRGLEGEIIERQDRLRRLAEEATRGNRPGRGTSAEEFLAEQALLANSEQGGLQLQSAVEARELIRQNVADQRELLRIRSEIELIDQGIANARSVEAAASLRETEEAERQAQAAELVEQAEDRRRRIEARRARGAQEAERAFEAANDAEIQHWQDLIDLSEEAAAAEHQRDTERIAAIDARVQAEWDAQQQIYEFGREQLEREKETLRDRQEFRHAQLEREKEDTLAALEATAQGAQSLTGTITGELSPALSGIFAELQKGNEASAEGVLRVVDQFLEAKAIEWAVMAVAEGAAAVASYATYQYDAGSNHLAAAAGYAAAAALAGVGGAAINVPTASSARAGAEPPPPGSGSAGGGNLTVNLYAPNAVMTEAERGQILASGLREARRSYGNSAVDF